MESLDKQITRRMYITQRQQELYPRALNQKKGKAEKPKVIIKAPTFIRRYIAYEGSSQHTITPGTVFKTLTSVKRLKQGESVNLRAGLAQDRPEHYDSPDVIAWRGRFFAVVEEKGKLVSKTSKGRMKPLCKKAPAYLAGIQRDVAKVLTGRKEAGGHFSLAAAKRALKSYEDFTPFEKLIPGWTDLKERHVLLVWAIADGAILDSSKQKGAKGPTASSSRKFLTHNDGITSEQWQGAELGCAIPKSITESDLVKAFGEPLIVPGTEREVFWALRWADGEVTAIYEHGKHHADQFHLGCDLNRSKLSPEQHRDRILEVLNFRDPIYDHILAFLQDAGIFLHTVQQWSGKPRNLPKLQKLLPKGWEAVKLYNAGFVIKQKDVRFIGFRIKFAVSEKSTLTEVLRMKLSAISNTPLPGPTRSEARKAKEAAKPTGLRKFNNKKGTTTAGETAASGLPPRLVIRYEGTDIRVNSMKDASLIWLEYRRTNRIKKADCTTPIQIIRRGVDYGRLTWEGEATKGTSTTEEK